MTVFSRKSRPATRRSLSRLTHWVQLESLEHRCLLSAGALDTTFGGGGIVSNAAAYDVAVQTDGNIVAAGKAANPFFHDPVEPDDPYYAGTYSFALARYNTNGSLDPNFGSGGILVDPTGTGSWDEAHAVIIQPDGKIIAAGGTGGNFSLARFNTDGSLDASFDSDGKVVTDLAGSEYIRGVALQPDGRIVAAGWGWFIDNTPNNNSEFLQSGNQGEQHRMDLMTVVTHELGHLLGHDHDDTGVMAETLLAGVRKTSLASEGSKVVDSVFSQFVEPQTNDFLSAFPDEHRLSRRPRLPRRR